MLKTRQNARRNTVTVDDRRAVLMMAKGRARADVVLVSHENFIRRELKSRMGWPQNEPANDALKTAARELATTILRLTREAEVAKVAAEKACKAAAEARMSVHIDITV